MSSGLPSPSRAETADATLRRLGETAADDETAGDCERASAAYSLARLRFLLRPVATGCDAEAAAAEDEAATDGATEEEATTALASALLAAKTKIKQTQ